TLLKALRLCAFAVKLISTFSHFHISTLIAAPRLTAALRLLRKHSHTMYPRVALPESLYFFSTQVVSQYIIRYMYRLLLLQGDIAESRFFHQPHVIIFLYCTTHATRIHFSSFSQLFR